MYIDLVETLNISRSENISLHSQIKLISKCISFQKKLKKLSKSNGFLDPFEENDDDVARIAKEFEKKYSGGYASKGRRSKKDDYYDKGAGYDESDSFIDNTEAVIRYTLSGIL